MQIAILGRQAGISLAELESLYGPDAIIPISSHAALVNSKWPLPQSRLGGTIKSGHVLTRFENTDLSKAFLQLQPLVIELQNSVPEGKLQLGVSIYGYKAQKNWLLKQMLTMKKAIKKSGRSVRIIENKSETLETAQVLYNKLVGPLGVELLVINDGKDTIIAQTTGIQDIDAYAERDYGRPKRDTYVGMLPPKLAQIMLNLALGDGEHSTTPDLEATESESRTPINPSSIYVLDPFCGTGVVLQEAYLMGYNVIGTDISQKMVDYTRENLAWLQSQYKDSGGVIDTEQADATEYQWPNSSKVNAVVCETYLGKPLVALPQSQEMAKITKEANYIAQTFLQNIAPQITTGTRLCVALPAWHLGDEKFQHLDMLDHLEDLGYNRLELVHASKKELIYHREDQVVARELTILEKM